jgi:DeoR/GlpR family transcriptional regulator of sugar metabolism
MAQTRQSFLLLSADKIGRSTSCLLGSLAKNFRLVTDATPPQLAAQKISTAFVQGARP